MFRHPFKLSQPRVFNLRPVNRSVTASWYSAGLFYYTYFPLWQAYFEKLGVELFSRPTNKEILEAGIRKQ